MPFTNEVEIQWENESALHTSAAIKSQREGWNNWERRHFTNLSLPFSRNELDGKSQQHGSSYHHARQMDGINFLPHFLTGMTCFWGPFKGQIIAWEFCDQKANISKFVEHLCNSKDDESFTLNKPFSIFIMDLTIWRFYARLISTCQSNYLFSLYWIFYLQC